MRIKEVRQKYPEYKISYIPQVDFDIGLIDTMGKVRRKDLYEDIFISSKKGRYWILYANTNSMTGSFKSKKDAVAWFRDGGR